MVKPDGGRLMTIRGCSAWVRLVALALAGMTATAAEMPCGDAKSHQFDFWIGDWEVTLRDGGKIVGFNRIMPILDGCVLQENWRGVSGSAGSSLNFYDTGTRRWRQFWVWREGTTLELAGEYRDGRMVLEGDSTEPDGKVVRNRITWFDSGDGSVRQLWEISRNASKTWEVVFDGIYRKRP